MNEIIAKKYVAALLSSIDSAQMIEIDKAFKDIASAFSLSKFKDILESPVAKNEEKVNFLLSLVDCKNEKFANFLTALAKAKRLEVLPQIAREFSYQKSLKDNSFCGTIYSSFDLNENSKKELEEKFSKKLNANISFESKKGNYDGIKIELADLGFEASFSMSLFKAKLSEYILKAIK